jgi:hypothetical protein
MKRADSSFRDIEQQYVLWFYYSHRGNIFADTSANYNARNRKKATTMMQPGPFQSSLRQAKSLERNVPKCLLPQLPPPPLRALRHRSEI